jgi:prolyl-tRNA editing enzyme YbaK/EbsC (Cys-tRNA(Pro) deacylase)
MNDFRSPVTQDLDRRGIPYRVFRHPGPVASLEQAAQERGQAPEQVIRSLLFRLSAENFVLALMAGPQQVDWKTLRRYLGEQRLTTASEEEVLRVTGYPLGAVSPFGLPDPRPTVSVGRILADPGVFAPEEISIGSGVRGTTIIMRTADLKKALPDVEIVPLQKSSR